MKHNTGSKEKNWYSRLLDQNMKRTCWCS